MRARILIIIFVMLFAFTNQALAKEKTTEKPAEKTPAVEKKAEKPKVKADMKGEIKVPSSVLNISKENTYPNSAQDLPYLEPSKLAKAMLKTSDVPITNPDLIRLLNESSINASKVAFWYRAKIYLGQWPLSYQSTETTVNWEHQEINTNRLDNRGAKATAKLYYNQTAHKKVTGGLTASIPNAEAVQKMMLITAAEKSKLPLAFQTAVGAGTKKPNVYHVSPKQVGYLHSYVPAVNERGRVTYGEVYIVLKGGKREIVIQNVTQQGIGAWIPVQDHVSLRFHTSNM
ncbi:YfkD famly protein [Fictibacillus phosphorivorans]|uniref:YfkD famly protein n=1 Tax=Fictibacillus phosphorivorans TaxID=1221500 RepID=UPI00203DE104|nr:YfkD famly protein [Fictibacillus phosphorivorans]MCM3720001.1 YfkD family protein [Fictibacillus phosphorivorans]MCM3777642.1 YfkD family protein [Fictibacillus phosphorivorans]